MLALCAKWEVNGAAIGAVTDTGRMRVLRGGELLGDMPVRALVDDCPLYDLEPAKPTTPLYAPPARRAGRRGAARARRCSRCSAQPEHRLAPPAVRAVRLDRAVAHVRRPEQADAAVLALPDGSRARASASTATAAASPPTPTAGTIEAVLECAANLACVGAEPLGTTNNLNFGNPEKPHIAWQLTESVRALGDACRALRAPIVGGNVSLYNEGASAGPIYPTPVIGMVGRLPDATRAGRLGFAARGRRRRARRLGAGHGPSLAASELAKLRGEPLPDGLPEIDLDAVIAAQAAIRDAVRAGALSSAHDIAEGGLAVALAECCLAGRLGAELELAPPAERLDPRRSVGSADAAVRRGARRLRRLRRLRRARRARRARRPLAPGRRQRRRSMRLSIDDRRRSTRSARRSPSSPTRTPRLRARCSRDRCC